MRRQYVGAGRTSNEMEEPPMFPRILVAIEFLDRDLVVTVSRRTGPGKSYYLGSGESFPSYEEAKAFGCGVAKENGHEDEPIDIRCEDEIADPENSTRH